MNLIFGFVYICLASKEFYKEEIKEKVTEKKEIVISDFVLSRDSVKASKFLEGGSLPNILAAALGPNDDYVSITKALRNPFAFEKPELLNKNLVTKAFTALAICEPGYASTKVFIINGFLNFWDSTQLEDFHKAFFGDE